MKLHSWLLLIILAAMAAFSALNWSTFVSPTNLSLGFTSVHMPLGLVMLGILVLIVMLCLMFVVYIQAKALLESHQHAKALKAQRELADQAELSRFTELRNYLESQLRAQEVKNSELKRTFLRASSSRKTISAPQSKKQAIRLPPISGKWMTSGEKSDGGS